MAGGAATSPVLRAAGGEGAAAGSGAEPAGAPGSPRTDLGPCPRCSAPGARLGGDILPLQPGVPGESVESGKLRLVGRYSISD